jgi:hypothetical protein
MRNFILGVLAGLVLATFAPRVADFARFGFDSGRELAGSAVEKTGNAARP